MENKNFNFDFFYKEKPESTEPILTMVFANMQPLGELYSTEDALVNGTLFKNIDKPFLAGGK